MNNKIIYTLSAIILMFIALHSCNINQKRKKKKCDCPGFSQLNALSPYFEIPNLNYLNEKKSHHS